MIVSARGHNTEHEGIHHDRIIAGLCLLGECVIILLSLRHPWK